MNVIEEKAARKVQAIKEKSLDDNAITINRKRILKHEFEETPLRERNNI